MKKYLSFLLLFSMAFTVPAFAGEVQEPDVLQGSEANVIIGDETPSEMLINQNEINRKKVGKKPESCPVLTYHHLTTDVSQTGSWTTTPEKFEKDLKKLLENGYAFITTDEWIEGQKSGGTLPEKPVIIQFDDGYTSVYELAYPILHKYNIPAEIYIITDASKETPYRHGNDLFLSWPQLKVMEDGGLIDIHLHGKSHVKITSLTSEQLAHDYEFAQKLIDEKLGPRMWYYVYPSGVYTEESLEIINDIGCAMQFVWAWEQIPDLDKYPVMLRMNVDYNSDVLEVIKGYNDIINENKDR
ncbi:polysaccharide deacetylase family protein [Anaerotignum faecicola]|nr:polysaccharide deacetylase family protein [Anaerotignum faecicola]